MFIEERRAAWAEISLGNIRDNYLAIRGLAPGCEVIACTKGDAYGHGIVRTAWELMREGVEYLGVATVGEAVQLRSAGINTRMVLLSPTPRENVKDVLYLGLIPVVTTLDEAKLLSSTVVQEGVKDDVPFFVALETGMGRIGFMPTDEAVGEIAALAALPGICMCGVLSHFATADEADLSYAQGQIGAFNGFCERLAGAGVDIGKRTIANSAGIMALPESHFDIIRPGIALYGIYPSETMDRGGLALKPVMSVKADIVYIKKVPAGFSVSYGRRFVTERESLIATLPIGYADGLPRATTGKGRALVRGRYVPIAGTICMDMCMVDVTDVPGVSEYDEVVLLGSQGDGVITAEEIATNAGTNTYEVVSRFGQRLPHKYV
ncbi:MAG: alanine racemase [Clostridiales bacterium]|nr:alanine racemase [Clostridiales bacterium]